MHLPTTALPGALPLFSDPAGQAIAAQAFGHRSSWFNPGPQYFSGELIISKIGAGLSVKEGTNARMGVATLVAGVVVVNNTAVTANSRIFVSGQNSSGTMGEATIIAVVPGTSFTIASTNALDTRIIAWFIIEPAP